MESTSLSSKSPLLRLLPIDALLSKGLIHLAVQVSCSTLSLRTGQDFKSIEPTGTCCAAVLQCSGEPPPPAVLSEKCSVPGWLGAAGSVTFRGGSSS